MDHHINQAEHNLVFLASIQEKFPDSFFDWKVTISFYIAIHYLKALAIKRGKVLGDTHYDIYKALNPKANPRLFQLPKFIWECYYDLYQYSQTARYDGFGDYSLHEEVQKMNFNHCAELMMHFTKYVKEQLVPNPI